MSQKEVKVLAVDDSVVYRSQVKEALNSIEGVVIGATASNGKIAIEKLSLESFDLVVLDLEMPEMNGLEVLAEITRLKIDVKVIVFSSISKRGARITVEALNAGACDFVTKLGPSSDKKAPALKIRELFEPKIKALFFNTEILSQETEERLKKAPPAALNCELIRPDIIVIASSTGGPSTLEKIFKEIRQPCSCPIVIAQHMPPLFTETFAQRLEKVSGLKVVEAKEGEVIQKGCVYIAPGDFHLKLKKNKDGNVVTCLDQGEKVHFVRPAADHLFKTAASIYRNKCLGIVLTGMGMDGAFGCEEVRENKGIVFIQKQSSCIVYGMPKAAKEIGAFDREVDLEEISAFINERAL